MFGIRMARRLGVSVAAIVVAIVGFSSAAQANPVHVTHGDTFSGLVAKHCNTTNWQGVAFPGRNKNLIFAGEIINITCPGAMKPAHKIVKKKAPPVIVYTATGWTNPLPGNFCSSGFGWRWGALHEGIDLVRPWGTPIHAAAAGVVKMARVPGGNHWGNGYGEETAIYHGGGVWTHYGHQSRIIVWVGEHVKAGQIIGYEGATGDVTGPHLHFEVETGNTSGTFRYGAQRNPAPWLRAHGVRVGC